LRRCIVVSSQSPTNASKYCALDWQIATRFASALCMALGCTMTKRRKIITWITLVLSLPAGGYAGLSFVFYAWLSAASPDRWPPERAALWAYSSLALAVLFVGLFSYCVVSLIKDANKTYRSERSAI